MTTPVPNPGGAGRFWLLPDIYTGPSGAGRFVPKVGDGVWDWNNGLFRVTAINSDLTCVLDSHTFDNSVTGVVQEDVLLGSGPGDQSESFRVYFSTTGPTPINITFDSRLHIYGSSASFVKLFLGTDVSSGGTVLQASVGLETVIMPGINNLAVQTLTASTSILPVADGEVITAVVCDASENVLSICKLLAQVTNAVSTTNTNAKYISSVAIVSPYLSPFNDRQLNYPLNVPIQNGAMQCLVTYSDATTVTLPIDDMKVKLLGKDAYTTSILGQNAKLILVYNLGPNEYAIGANINGGNKFIPVTYNVTTVDTAGAYTVKLFVCPRWARQFMLGGVLVTVGQVVTLTNQTDGSQDGNHVVSLSGSTYTLTPGGPTPTVPTNIAVNVALTGSASVTSRWILDYYLYNIERDQIILVTPWIENVAPLTGFNGELLNVAQPMTVAINLQNIVGYSFLYFRHVQTFNIKLFNSGSNLSAQNFWQIEYTPGDVAGAGDYAVATLHQPSEPLAGTYLLDISLGETDIPTWIARFFNPLEPLYFPGVETYPTATVNVPLTGTVPLTVNDGVINNGQYLRLDGQTVTAQNGFYRMSISGSAYTLVSAIEAPPIPPVPTHVNVYINGSPTAVELTLAEALNMPNMLDGISLSSALGSTIRLEFFKRVVNTDYQLASTTLNVVTQ